MHKFAQQATEKKRREIKNKFRGAQRVRAVVTDVRTPKASLSGESPCGCGAVVVVPVVVVGVVVVTVVVVVVAVVVVTVVVARPR